MTLIHQCCTCNQTLGACPISEKDLVVTRCFHIFHQSRNCLGGWIDSSEKTCPNCNDICYQHQSGKDFERIWKIFLIALEKMPETALEELSSSEHLNGQCTICSEAYPLIPLFFDPEQKCLFHEPCNPVTSAIRLTADDIVNIVKRCAEKDLRLKELLTPTAPNPLEGAQRNYPQAYQVVATVGAVALVALSFFGLKRQFV
jgi:hypothetical protein